MPNKPTTILIVEDEAPLRKALHDKLTHEGFAVAEAKDGIEGIMQARTVKPQLILLDIMMPRFDGFETLKELKKEPTLASIPVIMLTNLGQDEDIARGKKYGAAGYLIKANWKLEDIVQEIQKIIAKH